MPTRHRFFTPFRPSRENDDVSQAEGPSSCSIHTTIGRMAQMPITILSPEHDLHTHIARTYNPEPTFISLGDSGTIPQEERRSDQLFGADRPPHSESTVPEETHLTNTTEESTVRPPQRYRSVLSPAVLPGEESTYSKSEEVLETTERGLIGTEDGFFHVSGSTLDSGSISEWRSHQVPGANQALDSTIGILEGSHPTNTPDEDTLPHPHRYRRVSTSTSLENWLISGVCSSRSPGTNQLRRAPSDILEELAATAMTEEELRTRLSRWYLSRPPLIENRPSGAEPISEVTAEAAHTDMMEIESGGDSNDRPSSASGSIRFVYHPFPTLGDMSIPQEERHTRGGSRGNSLGRAAPQHRPECDLTSPPPYSEFATNGDNSLPDSVLGRFDACTLSPPPYVPLEMGGEQRGISRGNTPQASRASTSEENDGRSPPISDVSLRRIRLHRAKLETATAHAQRTVLNDRPTPTSRAQHASGPPPTVSTSTVFGLPSRSAVYHRFAPGVPNNPRHPNPHHR